MSVPVHLEYLRINNQSDMMEIDEEFCDEDHEVFDNNEQLHVDISFNFKDLKANGQYDTMEGDEEFFFESYEMIDLNSKKDC